MPELVTATQAANDKKTALTKGGFGKKNIIVKADMDFATLEGRKQLYNLIAGPSLAASDLIGQELAAIGYIVHDQEGEDEETGEVINYARTLILLEGGTHVSFGSKVIPHQLRNLEDCVGSAPWNPPVKVVVEELWSKKKRRYYSLRVVV